MQKIKKLISHKKIEDRIKLLAKDIIKENTELNFVVVLKGAKIFARHLAAEIKRISDIKVNVYEITLSSYSDKVSSSGVIDMVEGIKDDLSGKDVMIIDDILDTGLTLTFLRKYLLEEKKVKSVKICVLLDKKKKRAHDISADYECFKIDDVFVVGYGMDFNHNYRGLDYIGFIPLQTRQG